MQHNHQQQIVKACVLGAGLFLATQVWATTVEWTGAVANSCVITVSNHGSLGISTSGQKLSSEETTGMPAQVAVMSTGPNIVTFGTSSMTLAPATYAGSPLSQMKHTSNQGHSNTWQTAPHDVSVNAGNTVFQVHAQATDSSNVFPMGLYKVSSDVTCSQ